MSIRVHFTCAIIHKKGELYTMFTFMDNLMEKMRKLTPKWLTSAATYIYIFSMLVIFPLFFTDGMFNLYLDKRNFFLFFSIAYICILLPTALVALYDWGNQMYAPKKTDMIFALILMSAFIISTIFASNFNQTFFEMTSRTISGLCFLFCMLTFFAIRQFANTGKLLLWTWIGGSSALYLFGILCACGFNVLNAQNGLAPEQLPTYLTPMSNTNFNSVYVCIMLPPIMAMYMLCKDKLSQTLCRINLYLGFMFTFFIKTESSTIAIILGLILLGYFALESDSWSERYIHITGIYLAAKLTIHILLNLFPDRLYAFHGLGLLLLNNTVLICELICYAAFFLLWNWKKNIIREKLANVRKIFIILGVSLACCCIACILYANINAANISEESFLHKLVLTDTTFSGRGLIWKRTASVLKEEPIGRKLIGNGLNSFRSTLELTYGPEAGDMSFADPHNEIMQMAMDMGVLGLIGYFGLFVSSLLKGLKNWKKDKFQIIAVLTLSVYMIQALANEYSIYTLPLLFILLGLTNRKSE